MFTDRHMFSSITDRNRLDVVNNVAIIMLGYVETMQRVQRHCITMASNETQPSFSG